MTASNRTGPRSPLDRLGTRHEQPPGLRTNTCAGGVTVAPPLASVPPLAVSPASPLIPVLPPLPTAPPLLVTMPPSASTHLPAMQVPPVQAKPSSWRGSLQPPAVMSQVPGLWHSSSAVQVTVLPAQTPFVHLSPVVQASPSEQLCVSSA